MYEIYKVKIFEKKESKILSPKESQELKCFIERLRINPYIGKPLGFSFFREKKLGNKRVYFLIYDDICIVLIVGLSNKKQQQEIIMKIHAQRITFRKYAEEKKKYSN